MVEKNPVFSSKIKYGGIFPFADFYRFCYEYLVEELGFDVAESVYGEKLSGDVKNIDVEWKGETKVDDYFKYEIKVVFRIIALSNVEIEKEGKRKKSNKGDVEVAIKGLVMTDYKGEYATKPVRRLMKNIYDKWVIPSRIEKIEEKLISDCDEFLGQAKAYLDLEGKK